MYASHNLAQISPISHLRDPLHAENVHRTMTQNVTLLAQKYTAYATATVCLADLNLALQAILNGDMLAAQTKVIDALLELQDLTAKL